MRKHAHFYWFIFQLLFPILFFVLTWLALYFFTPFSAHKALGDGGLVVFASLLVLSSVASTYDKQRSRAASSNSTNFYDFAFGLGMLFAVGNAMLYMVIRLVLATTTIPEAGAVPLKIHYCLAVSILTALFAIAWCIYVLQKMDIDSLTN